MNNWPIAATGKTQEECISKGLGKLASWRDHNRWNYDGGDLFGRITEVFHLIWPDQSHGDVRLYNDRIEWTCEEGAIEEARYKAVMVPAPTNAPYYCGFAQLNQNDGRTALVNAGYTDIRNKLPICIGKSIGTRRLVNAMLTERNKGVEVDFLNILHECLAQWAMGSSFRMTEGGWETNVALEALRLKLGYENPIQFDIDTLGQDLYVRRELGIMFNLPYVGVDRSLFGLYVVPAWLYELNREIVAKGWAPVTPQWLSPTSYQYNRGYQGECRGSFKGYRCQPGLSRIELRALSCCSTAYNLHVPENPINSTLIQPPAEWEQCVTRTIGAFLCGAPGTAFPIDQRQAFGLAMLREIPLIVTREDLSLDYFRLRMGKLCRPGGPSEIDVMNTTPDGGILRRLTGERMINV